MRNLREYQAYIKQAVKERGFDKETPHQVFGLLVEEIGELAKALRKMEGMKTGQHSKVHGVEEEASDVFFLLLDLCNRIGVDLEKSFNEKEQKNINRYLK